MAKRKRKANWVVRLSVLCFIAYVALTLISMQLEVLAMHRQIDQLDQDIVQEELANAEKKRVLAAGTDDDYIERIARDKLGYAYPDEKIFIDRSGN